jgi:hypothetical protein
MKGSMRAATALGVGYLLGRRRKLRTAILMAAATAVGNSSAGGVVLQRVIKMAGSTEVFGKLAPQLGEITDAVRGDLLATGKAAIATAVSNQVDSLTGAIHERAERLRNPAAMAEDAGEAVGTAGRAASSGGRRAASTAEGAARRAAGRGESRTHVDDYEADEVAGQEDYDDREGPERDGRGGRDDYAEREPEDYEDADHDEPDGGETGDGRAARHTAESSRRAAAGRRSPVRRARR